MDTRQAHRASMAMADMMAQGYLGDLSDADLLVRPVPGANHIAWQLGHLIASERGMMEQVAPGSMPALPAGFKEKHTKETAGSDDPNAFLTKDEYLKLHAAVRAATLAVLDRTSDADFDKPAPESMQGYAPTIGDLFVLHGQHWTMHSGQWAVIRRKLGRPPLF
jgi:hypothetical protein